MTSCITNEMGDREYTEKRLTSNALSALCRASITCVFFVSRNPAFSSTCSFVVSGNPAFSLLLLHVVFSLGEQPSSPEGGSIFVVPAF